MRYAAQCLGAGLEFPLESPSLETQIAQFASPGRGPAYVRITASNGRHPRTVESAVAGLGNRVDLWTVGGTHGPGSREIVVVRSRERHRCVERGRSSAY